MFISRPKSFNNTRVEEIDAHAIVYKLFFYQKIQKKMMKNLIFAAFLCTCEGKFWQKEIGRGQKYTGNPTGEAVSPLDSSKIPDYISSHFKQDGDLQSTDEELHFYPANYTGEKFYTVIYKENGEVLDYQNIKIADATVYMNTLAPKLKVIIFDIISTIAFDVRFFAAHPHFKLIS